ncbi:BsuBI/PstI family type II restriction endonuclease [Verrucosispora sp. TAA-831]|uniref:BsuBI/PstI family type II restriction endonuclease n=1 Tax=Verrucosispora sp. TAA-831 TaxID=3422227 RepID=UPI003D6F0A5F
MINEDEKRQRIARVLTALGQYSPEREAAILALDDENLPNPIKAMAKLGFKFSDGAPNRKLLEEVARRIGRSTPDRENRDYVQLPLREAGILIIGTADPGQRQFIRYYWKPKSPYDSYMLDDEFRSLLHSDTGEEFEAALSEWIRGTDSRRARMKTAEAAAWAANEGGRLVPTTVSLYCANFLADYEVVYVDDRDGDRIGEAFRDDVHRLGIPLNLGSRWPDIILRNPVSRRFWVVDCVENDGELDYLRRDEIATSFAAEGLEIAGFTTAYRSIRKFAERQRRHDNIANGTFVWIMEIGGSHWHKLLPRVAQCPM